MRLFLLFLVLVSLDVSASCRSSSVKHRFDVLNGYHHGRKGFVVDHICALAMGGLDDVKNLQYQTIAESKAKDKIENTLAGKAEFCNPDNSTKTRQVFNCKRKNVKK